MYGETLLSWGEPVWTHTHSCHPQTLPLWEHHVLHYITVSYTAYGKILQSHSRKKHPPIFFLTLYSPFISLQEFSTPQRLLWGKMNLSQSLKSSQLPKPALQQPALRCPPSPRPPQIHPLSQLLVIWECNGFLKFLSRSTMIREGATALN